MNYFIAYEITNFNQLFGVVKLTKHALTTFILTAEKRYSINFTKENKKSCLSLHYNETKLFIC